jgi:hypothetical protein
MPKIIGLFRRPSIRGRIKRKTVRARTGGSGGQWSGALLRRVRALRLPRSEKKELHHGLVKIFKDVRNLSRSNREHVLKTAVWMLEHFPKYRHNISARLILARLQTIVGVLTPQSGERFRIKYKAEHTFPDGHTEEDIYIMEADHFGEVAFFY